MAVLKDRITVVETVYFQSPGKEVEAVESRFYREIETKDEQLYQRRCKATEEWQPLDHGWIESASMLVIKNEEGTFPHVKPTEEEVEEASKKVLEVRFNSSPLSWLVPPKESFRGTPSDISKIKIRCQSGIAKFTAYVYPS